MREIKFRALEKPSQMVLDMGYKPKMLYGTGVVFDPVNTWLVSNDKTKPVAFGYVQNIVDPETVGQFTGLHDKNGREIYEGDKFCISGIIMFVSWNEDRASFILTTGRGYDTINCINLDCDVVYKKEIIGNIHEQQS